MDEREIKITGSTVADLLKEVGLWFFDRLLFDIEQRYNMVTTYEQSDLELYLNSVVDDPKTIYSSLNEIYDERVTQLDKCFHGRYIFTPIMIKKLFSLGWGNNVHAYYSIPFIDIDNTDILKDYNFESMITNIANVNNATYFSFTLCCMKLSSNSEIRNKRFYDVFEQITTRLQKEFDEHLHNINYGNDDDGNDSEDEINEDDYDDNYKTICRFHAVMDPILEGYSDNYITRYHLHGYYMDKLHEFENMPASINSVTIDLCCNDNSSSSPSHITHDTAGLSYKEIFNTFKVYKVCSDFDDITIDEEGNLTVVSC